MGMDIFNAGVNSTKKAMEDQDKKEYSSKNSDFICERTGEDSFAISTDGITVNEVLTINGTADLSDIIRFNDGGYVKRVRLINNPSSFSLGGYKYEIEVIGSGPRGFSSGSGYLRFTDKSGDTYRLALHKSEERKHVVDYSSDKPDIVKIEWSNVSFDVVDKQEKEAEACMERKQFRDGIRKRAVEDCSSLVYKEVFELSGINMYGKRNGIIAFYAEYENDESFTGLKFTIISNKGDKKDYYETSNSGFLKFFALAYIIPYIHRNRIEHWETCPPSRRFITEDGYLADSIFDKIPNSSYIGPVPTITDYAMPEDLEDLPDRVRKVLYNVSVFWLDGTVSSVLRLNNDEFYAWLERLKRINQELKPYFESIESQQSFDNEIIETDTENCNEDDIDDEESTDYDYTDVEEEREDYETDDIKKGIYGFAANVSPQKLDELADLALEEKWYYGDKPPVDRPYPILEKYLKHTYTKLKREKKVLVNKDKDGHVFAAFNTGLVDKKYEYIYALFVPNKTTYDDRKWVLNGFYVAGEDWGGKKIVELFNPLPAKADYFGGDINNMLFDSTAGNVYADFEHIICERIGRFPLKFIADNIGDVETRIFDMELSEAFYCTDKTDREEYFKELGNRIGKNTQVLTNMVRRVEDATNFAKKRTEWNYKTAIPMYYPTKDKGSLLLPLSLVNDSKADLALVVERQKNGSYQGHTVLTLEMAYSNSRLVTRPDSDWLRTNDIFDQ